MPISQTLRLPTALREYQQTEEQIMRRTVEQALEKLRSEMYSNMTKFNKVESLSLRRFQFLLMGG